MDVSGSPAVYSFAPRITTSFEVAEPAIKAWAKMCTRMAVFEHSADSTVSSTHIHVLMLGCKVQEERLKRIFKDVLPGITEKGNALWSWEHKKFGTPDDQFLTYMSKGVLRPKFVKEFPAELVEERRQQWKITTPKSVESSQKSDMYEDMCKAFFAQHDPVEMADMAREFDAVRKWVFAWFYRRTGKIPHTTQYKQYAGSLFMKLGEKCKRFEQNSQEVFSLWY